MGRFINWLKSASQQQSAANDAEDTPVAATSESVDPTFSWSNIDLADSSIFDTGKLTAQKSMDKNPASYNAPDSESYLVREEKTGFDPYNSGRFDTKNK